MTEKDLLIQDLRAENLELKKKLEIAQETISGLYSIIKGDEDDEEANVTML